MMGLETGIHREDDTCGMSPKSHTNFSTAVQRVEYYFMPYIPLLNIDWHNKSCGGQLVGLTL